MASLCEEEPQVVALFFVFQVLGALKGSYGLQMSPCSASAGSRGPGTAGPGPSLALLGLGGISVVSNFTPQS